MSLVQAGVDGVPSGDHPRYSPYAIIPQLNDFGANGWELITAHPVNAGRNHDFMISAGGSSAWGRHYFCVFKRRLV